MKPASILLGVAAILLAGCGALGGTPAPSGRVALAAGTYTSTFFKPPVTFTLPDGWLVASDTPDYLGLEPVETDQVGIHLFRDPMPASQDPACLATAEPGVAPGAVALATWIRGRPGLASSSPRLVTIGGLSGVEIDLAIKPGWTESCPFAEGLPTAPLFVGSATSSFRWVVAGSERLRLSLLDLPGGGTVVVDIDAFQGELFDAFLARATPIVARLAFAGP